MTKTKALIASTIVFAVSACVLLLALRAANPTIPSSSFEHSGSVTVSGYCPEDAVIVGKGDYQGGVGWDRYACVPLDNLTRGE